MKDEDLVIGASSDTERASLWEFRRPLFPKDHQTIAEFVPHRRLEPGPESSAGNYAEFLQFLPAVIPRIADARERSSFQRALGCRTKLLNGLSCPGIAA